MAKKKEKEFKILEVPLPSGQNVKKMTKLSWAGINYRNTKDSGEISAEKNISADAAPYLIPSEKREMIMQVTPMDLDATIFEYEAAILSDMYGYGNNIILMFEQKYAGSQSDNAYTIYGGTFTVIDLGNNIIIGSGKLGDFTDWQPYVHQLGAGITAFSTLQNYKNIALVDTVERLLFFPFSVNIQLGGIIEMRVDGSVATSGWTEHEICENWLKTHGKQECQYRFPQIEDDYKWYYYDKGLKAPAWVKSNKYYIPDKASEVKGMPVVEHVCVAHQRLFGIDNNRVFASGYNDYSNWSLDTADTYSADNAWVSSLVSRNGMKSPNVGIITYSGSVFVFKNESTFEITNTKNPFRVHEVFSVGAISQRAIQVVGDYLIFVGKKGVKLYNGTTLKDIGYNLNVDTFYSAVTGTDGRKFYLYSKTDKKDKNLFVYDTYTGLWAEEDTTVDFAAFAKSDAGMFGISSDFKIYRLDTGNYAHDWFAVTDLSCNGSVDIKHIKKIQMLADIGAGSTVSVYLLYDDEEFDEEKSHLIFTKKNTGTKEIKLPIRTIPRKTANYGFKIYIKGNGYAKIYQAELLITQGGDKYVEG